jgi:PAS domain S-box-containing protein
MTDAFALIHFGVVGKRSCHSFNCDAAPDAMLSFDSEGLVVMANKRAEILFGYRREDLIGPSIIPLVPIEIEAIESGNSEILVTGYRRAGSDFLAETSFSAIENHSSPNITATVRDVSIRSEVEAERMRVKSEAERVRLGAVAEHGRLEAAAALGTKFQFVEKPFDQKMLLENVGLALDARLKTLKQDN